MSFIEKLNNVNENKYLQMETIKDKLFKKKYFAGSELKFKQTTILNIMERMQVTLPELSKAIRGNFKYAYIV